MKLSGNNLLLSCDILGAHKLRTLLSVTGVVVGVGAMVLMVSVGRGAEKKILDMIRSMGVNMIVVNSGQTRIFAGRMLQVETVTTLVPADAAAIVRQCPSVAGATPVVSKRVSARWGAENTNTTVVGMSPEGFELRSIGIALGRAYNTREGRTRQRVAVLGPTVVQNLFPGVDDPVGQRFRVGQVPFEVIGIAGPRGVDINGRDLDDVILVPLETAMHRLLNVTYLESVYAQARSADALEAAGEEIAALLRDRHRLRGKPDDFTIQNQAALIRAERETVRSMTFLIGSVAGISLLVGGVGILAVMLISVTERTREIGLRRALGAKRGDIRAQFLCESVVLAFTGGILGVAAGVAAAAVFPVLGYWDTVISWPAAGVGFAFSAAVGVIFGLYPASRAAALEPINALRAE